MREVFLLERIARLPPPAKLDGEKLDGEGGHAQV
jgi:hypothetical protein